MPSLGRYPLYPTDRAGVLKRLPCHLGPARRLCCRNLTLFLADLGFSSLAFFVHASPLVCIISHLSATTASV